MSHGDRTGPIGQGPKTGRAMGYCSGSDSPDYMTGIPAGATQGVGREVGRSMSRGAGRGFWCRKGRGGKFAAGKYSGYYYPAPAKTSVESNVELFENRIRSLKQELETFIESLKTSRSLEAVLKLNNSYTLIVR